MPDCLADWGLGLKAPQGGSVRKVPMLALVIDDCRVTRRFLARILQGLGIQVIEASDGREALQRLREHDGLTLVLVDWRMPEMTGYEFIKAVRAERRYDDLRIMMVTS